MRARAEAIYRTDGTSSPPTENSWRAFPAQTDGGKEETRDALEEAGF